MDVWEQRGPGHYHVNVGFLQHESFMDPDGGAEVGGFDLINLDSMDWGHLYNRPTNEIQSDNPEIIQLAKEIINGVPDPMNQILAVHDWVAKNISYDVDNYSLWLQGKQMAFVDSLTALHSRRSICFGYSTLYAALLRSLGFRVKIAEGAVRNPTKYQFDSTSNELAPSEFPDWETVDKNADGSLRIVHAWNEILFDGKWIPVDVTWDSGSVDEKTDENQVVKFVFRPNFRHRYFNSPENMALDHLKIQDRLDVPK